MSSLDRALVAVITCGAPWVATHLVALRKAGARVRVCTPDERLWSILSALDYEVIVIADVEQGESALARALAEDPKLRAVPALHLLAPGTTHAVATELVTVDGSATRNTVAAVEALVDVQVPRRPSKSPPSGEWVAPEVMARRKLDAGVHDLRVLLGVVVGYGSNLRDGVEGPLSEGQRGHILKMIEAASDATALLAQTVSAIRSAALGVPVEQPARTRRSLVDLSAVAGSVVRMFARAAAQRGIDLAGVTPEPVRVWGNPVHLKQVIANLVVNAVKFTPAGGQVRVTTRASTSTQAEIVVSDTGPGVPEADRERIFGHGVRLERDQATRGTGVGLALVRKLVFVHHGGTVRVADARGGGAEFIVSLPVDRRARERQGSAPSHAPVVVDNPGRDLQ